MNIEKIKQEARTEFAKKGVKARWKDKTDEEKSEHGRLMAKAKKAKKNKGKLMHS